MADPRFFIRHGPYRLDELARLSGAALAAGTNPDQLISDVAALDTAGPEELSFLDNTAYLGDLENSGAGACVIESKFADRAPTGMALLLSPEPYRAYAMIAQAFYPLPPLSPGTASTAVVDESARIGVACEIGANAVVGANVEIGARCLIGNNAVIGPGVQIGDDCRIHAGVVVSHCLIGQRVTLHPGVKVGQGGFGFAINPDGHVRIPQVGRVIIESDCRIGANTTIDRGHAHDTVIGQGCWIDNLVQIGHNAQLGRGCVIVAQVGISGSTKLGHHVAVGGQTGFAGHLHIGDGAQVAAQSGVMNDLPPGASVAGSPATAIREFFRQVATVRRLSQRKDSKNG